MKWAIRIIILIIFVMAIALAFLTCRGSCTCIQRIDEMVPDTDIAPYEVQTATHYYYAREAEKLDSGDALMVDWYEQDGKKWVFRKGAETIPKVLKPVVRRR